MAQHPLTKRIACDECPAMVGAELVYPHEGQWIELLPLQTVDDVFKMSEWGRLTVDIAAAEGDPGEQAAINLRLTECYKDFAAILADRITAWNWTDAVGRKLPTPTEKESFYRLTDGELWWLITVLRTNGAHAERGKGRSGTQITSSATSPQPSPIDSATAPSPQADD